MQAVVPLQHVLAVFAQAVAGPAAIGVQIEHVLVVVAVHVDAVAEAGKQRVAVHIGWQQMCNALKHGLQHGVIGHPMHRLVHAHARWCGDARRFIAVAHHLGGLHDGVGLFIGDNLVDHKAEQAIQIQVVATRLQVGLRTPLERFRRVCKRMHGGHGHHAAHGQRTG